MSATTSTATAPLRRGRVRTTTPRRHLRVVDRAPRRHPVLFLVLYLVVAAGIVMGAVSLNALAAGDAIEIRELSNQLSVDERTYDQLIAEVATLEAPERIQRLAEQMGMVPATSPRHVQPLQELRVDRGTTPTDDEVKSLMGLQG